GAARRCDREVASRRMARGLPAHAHSGRIGSGDRLARQPASAARPQAARVVVAPGERGSKPCKIRSPRDADVRFMLLPYNAPGGKEIWAAMTDAERSAEEAGYRELIRSMREQGVLLDAQEVEHYDAARTVRVRDDVVHVSSGPAVIGDEYLTGYFLIDVESFEIATEWAARIPNARSGSAEIRPVMDIDW